MWKCHQQQMPGERVRDAERRRRPRQDPAQRTKETAARKHQLRTSRQEGTASLPESWPAQ